jgi:glycosyltransferase involved in cell wall biosynthesis
MKIAYIANMRMPTERAHGLQVMRMCEAFARLGNHVILFYPYRFQSNPDLHHRDAFEFFGIQTPFEIRRVPYLDLFPLGPYLGRNLFRPFYTLSNFIFGLTAAMQASRSKADLYYTREYMVAWQLIRRGYPTILEVHQWVGALSRRIISAFNHASALRLIVTISHGLKYDLLKAGVPKQKIIVLPDAVDMRSYEKPLTKAEARRLLGLPQDVPLIVYTGSLFHSRGVYVLAESSRYLSNALVILVGGSPQEQLQMRSFIQEQQLEQVLLWGHVPPSEVPVFQQAADVLAHPQLGVDAQHFKHSSPLKLFEYMAARRPIVASDLPALREVLEHERNALLVPPGDPVALAQAIQRLLDDPQLSQRLADAAFEQVHEWTWEQRAQKILEKLNEEKL